MDGSPVSTAHRDILIRSVDLIDKEYV
jgi:hypothetical protein